MSDDLCFLAETANPRKELITDFNVCCYNKVFFSVLIIERVFSFAESLNGSVQEFVDKANLNSLLFAAEHTEHLLTVFLYVYLCKSICAIPRCACA